jgi:hypothetical protein
MRRVEQYFRFNGLSPEEALSPNTSDDDIDDVGAVPLPLPLDGLPFWLPSAISDAHIALAPEIRRALMALDLARATRAACYHDLAGGGGDSFNTSQLPHVSLRFKQEERNRVTQARQISIDLVKAKPAYCEYLAAVPKHLRTAAMPQTPPSEDAAISTRHWRYIYGAWDKSVKNWRAGM